MKAKAPIILHVFSTFARGGSQLRTVDLIKSLDGAFRHRIVAMDGCYDAQSLLEAVDNVELLRPPAQHGHLLNRLRTYKSWLDAQAYDLLATYNWGAIEIAAAQALSRRCPHLHHEDGFGPDERDKRHLRRNLFRRFVFKGVDAVIVPSQTLMTIARSSWGAGPDKLHLIENGIDVTLFKGERGFDALGLEKGPDDLWVGCVAGLRPEKRLDRLLRVFSDLENKQKTRLILVGDGALQEALMQQSQALGLENHVSFPGFVPSPHRYLAALDCFTLSSDTEQFPISLVEAMAAGLPIVATDVGDVKRILPASQHEFICAANDERSFKHNLNKILSSTQLRQKLGAENRKHVEEHYDFAQTLSAYQNLYNLAQPA